MTTVYNTGLISYSKSNNKSPDASFYKTAFSECFVKLNKKGGRHNVINRLSGC